MSHLGYGKNEYGTLISKHCCDTCGTNFTVCPAQFPEAQGWGNCMAPTCKSYDPSRDADKMFEEGVPFVLGSPTGKA